jgi:hypothetical protein
MNTYHKFAPNVFAAKCTEQHAKGDTIILETKHGKEHECIVFNFLGQTKDGFYLYSIVRADGYNAQERAKAKAERLKSWVASAERKSEQYYQASQEGREFLALGEPIKIGHHSERRHRALIERNHERMGKSIEFDKKAAEHESKAEYWKHKETEVNLSMPESLEMWEHKLEAAKAYHLDLKNNPEKRHHSMSLQYANKAVKDAEENLRIAVKLWGDAESVAWVQQAEKEKAESKMIKTDKQRDIVERNNGFFSFNNNQFYEGYNKLKAAGIVQEGEKVVHVGMGLYIPKVNVEGFLSEWKRA